MHNNVKEFSPVPLWCTFTEEASSLDGLTSFLGGVGTHPRHSDADADDNGGSKGGSVSGAVNGGKGEGKIAYKSKTTKTKKKRNEQFSRIIIPTLDRYAQV
mgnify:CR=1 FL=1